MLMMKRILFSLAISMFLSVSAFAAGFPGAPTPAGTHLGSVKTNPYGNAPLTALVALKGKDITDVKVTVQGKGSNGVDITYPVGKETMLTHDGVPVFGLYQNYTNDVSVSFKDLADGKTYTDKYKVMTSGIQNKYIDNRNLSSLPVIKVVTVAKGFEGRLYMTNTHTAIEQGSDLNWAGNKAPSASLFDPAPATGSLPFEMPPELFIVDTQGEYRWWFNQDALYDANKHDIDQRGYLMGLRPTANGTFTFVMGQNWGEIDMLGKILYKHKLPRGYLDASHESVETPKGTVLVRAAKRNYARPDGFMVNTVRDHILELDKSGRLIDVWSLPKMMDPLRDALLLALDLGAVCMNVDLTQAGKTAGKFEPTDAPYGDIPGVGAGRNWAHVNSIQYDKSDDSIILSFRHQGVAKIGRDKQVKWVLAPSEGWNPALTKKLLTPVDAAGKKLECNPKGECKNTDFDFVYTQHTAWLSPKGTLTVFDNGDGRHLTQPAVPTMKYSRFVEYKIDEKNMTVQQVWEYGKERGYDWYSPITSNVEYRTDKDTMYGFGGSTHLLDGGKPTIGKHNEIDYKTKKVMVEIDVYSDKPNNTHYRGVLVEQDKIFAK